VAAALNRLNLTLLNLTCLLSRFWTLPVRALLAILSMRHRHNTRFKKKSRHIGMDYSNKGYIFYYHSVPDDYYLAEQKENMTRLKKYRKHLIKLTPEK
jgi:hypothetical protein